MSYKDLLKIIPVVQSTALVENSFDLVRRKKKKKIVRNAIETIVGVNIIKEESKFL
jgi:hypothetical protein